MPVFKDVAPVVQSAATTRPTPPQPIIKEISTEQTPSGPGAETPSRPVHAQMEPPRKIRRPHLDHLSTPSISGMLNGDHLKAVAEPDQTLSGSAKQFKNKEFDKEQLVDSWKLFAETIEAPQLKSALSVREPLLLENSRVEYHLDNEVQRQRIILDLKPKLLAHLHNTLHNELIDIEFKITENKEEILNKPYTDQEKFNALALKYPVLMTMKQRFGLDFE